MPNAEDAIFACPSEDELIVYSHSFSAKLPESLKYVFRVAFSRYVIRFGCAKTYRVIKNRTVADVIANAPSDPSENSVIASGSIDGVGYTLHDPSQEEVERDDNTTDERD
jgi:hypothetical protein